MGNLKIKIASTRPHQPPIYPVWSSYLENNLTPEYFQFLEPTGGSFRIQPVQGKASIINEPEQDELSGLTKVARLRLSPFRFFQAMANPPGGKLFLDAVLSQTRRQPTEINLIKRLVLIEA